MTSKKTHTELTVPSGEHPAIISSLWTFLLPCRATIQLRRRIQACWGLARATRTMLAEWGRASTRAQREGWPHTRWQRTARYWGVRRWPVLQHDWRMLQRNCMARTQRPRAANGRAYGPTSPRLHPATPLGHAGSSVRNSWSVMSAARA